MQTLNLLNGALERFQPAKLRPAPKKTVKVLVIVDPTVENYHTLIRNFAAAEVFVLDSTRDGIEQVTEVLSRCTGVETLEIISPNCPGRIQLGSIWLDHTTLETHGDQLRTWQQALTSKANILLHGFKVAMGIEGMGFLGRLSLLTGAMVSTSGMPVNSSAPSERLLNRHPIGHPAAVFTGELLT